MEPSIAHRALWLKDTVTLGFVRHKSNLTRRERLAPQSKSIFSDCEKDKELLNSWAVILAYFQCSRSPEVASSEKFSVPRVSVKKAYVTF